MSYHHIQKHVARPLVLWFENDFHHCKYNIEIIFRKYENVKMTIWHIMTHCMVEGHIYNHLAAVQVFAFQLQVAEYSQWMEWSTSAATCSLVYFLLLFDCCFLLLLLLQAITTCYDMFCCRFIRCAGTLYLGLGPHSTVCVTAEAVPVGWRGDSQVSAPLWHPLPHLGLWLVSLWVRACLNTIVQWCKRLCGDRF